MGVERTRVQSTLSAGQMRREVKRSLAGCGLFARCERQNACIITLYHHCHPLIIKRGGSVMIRMVARIAIEGGVCHHHCVVTSLPIITMIREIDAGHEARGVKRVDGEGRGASHRLLDLPAYEALAQV